MRYSASEKYEIIRLVESSSLSALLLSVCRFIRVFTHGLTKMTDQRKQPALLVNQGTAVTDLLIF
jgi:hypothetical protein